MSPRESFEGSSFNYDGSVVMEQSRTRDKLFAVAGNVVDFGADAAAFSAWSLGRVGRGAVDSASAFYRGAVKKSFNTSD